MSDTEILEIEVNDGDLVDVQERRVVQEEPVWTRTVRMVSEETVNPSDYSTTVNVNSAPVQPASAATSGTSVAILNASNSACRANRYKQRINLVHPHQQLLVHFPIDNSPPDRRFVIVMSDSEDEEEEFESFTYSGHQLPDDDEDRRPWRRGGAKKIKLPNPVKAFIDFQWQDKLGREYNDAHLVDVNPTNMPVISRTEANRLISRQGPYFVNIRRPDFSKVTQYKTAERTDPQTIKDFLVSVKAWRCLCFDTEDDGKSPFLQQPNRGQPGRVPVIFGSPDGQVLIFHDPRDVPQSIKDICADFAYVKLQSGIENDIKLLEKSGFKFRGIVDVQTLFALAKPELDACGIQECTRYVWETTSFEKLRIPWLQKFKHQYANQNMTGDCLAHSIQDVLTPYAIALKLAIEVSDLRDLKSPTENIFPAMNEAFELCMSKSPADLRNPSACYLDKSKCGKINNWINDICPSFSLPFQFNSHFIVQRIRRARGDLVERFDTGLTQPQIIERAQRHLNLLKGRLPTATEQAFLDLRYHLLDHCRHCGSQDHESDVCTVLAVPCQYEHGPEVVHQPHSIICCPSLHAFCNKCRTRGHVREVHGRNWKSAGELRRIFLESAPFGLYTSLPYLNRDPKNAKYILPYHYKAGLGGKRLGYNMADYWLYGGVDKLTEEEYSKGQPHRDLTLRNLTAAQENYEQLNTRAERRREEERAAGAAPTEAGGPKRKRTGAEQRRRKKRRAEAEKDKVEI